MKHSKLDVKKFRCVRLLTGELLVCILNKETKKFLHVTSPVVVHIVPVQNEDGTVDSNVFFNKYIPFTSQTEFTISKVSVVSTSSLNKDITRIYIQALSLDTKAIKRTVEPSDDDLEVEFTPDEDADYKEEIFKDGAEKELKKEEIHPMLRSKKKSDRKPN